LRGRRLLDVAVNADVAPDDQRAGVDHRAFGIPAIELEGFGADVGAQAIRVAATARRRENDAGISLVVRFGANGILRSRAETN